LLIDENLCRLCLVYSRSKDLIAFNRGSELPKLLRYIADLLDRKGSRTEIFAESYNYVKMLADFPDPYIYMKKQLTEIGKKVAEKVRRYLAERNWDLHEAIKISAAANIIDTSVIGYEPIELDKAIWDRPAIDEYTEIPKDKKIVIVLDNAGEAEIDFILAETLVRNGYNIAIAVRKEPYEIDIAYHDIADRVTDLNVEIITTPSNISPVAHLKDCFAIIKGIANLESNIEMGMVESLHLFRAKCEVLTKIFNIPKNSPIIITGKVLKNLFRFC